MHDWQQIKKRERWSELRGCTREGKMRYWKKFLVQDRCALCGVSRDIARTEKVDH